MLPHGALPDEMGPRAHGRKMVNDVRTIKGTSCWSPSVVWTRPLAPPARLSVSPAPARAAVGGGKIPVQSSGIEPETLSTSRTRDNHYTTTADNGFFDNVALLYVYQY